MKRLIAIAILAAALMACAGTPFEWSAARKLHVGMTELEITAIMGPPYLVKSTAEGTTWVWSYAEVFWPGSSRSISVGFKNGKVTWVPDLPEFYQ
jgi:hypothetical protein